MSCEETFVRTVARAFGLSFITTIQAVAFDRCRVAHPPPEFAMLLAYHIAKCIRCRMFVALCHVGVTRIA